MQVKTERRRRRKGTFRKKTQLHRHSQVSSRESQYSANYSCQAESTIVGESCFYFGSSIYISCFENVESSKTFVCRSSCASRSRSLSSRPSIRLESSFFIGQGINCKIL